MADSVARSHNGFTEVCMIQKKNVSEYVDTIELANYFGVSPKTISNNSHKIKGRAKIGGAVRYHLPTVKYNVQQKGENLFGGRK